MSGSRINAYQQKNRGIGSIQRGSDQFALSRSIRYLPDQSGKARVSQTETLDQSGDVESIRNHKNSKIKNRSTSAIFYPLGELPNQGCKTMLASYKYERSSNELANTQIHIEHKRKERAKAFTSPNYQRLTPMSIN